MLYKKRTSVSINHDNLAFADDHFYNKPIKNLCIHTYRVRLYETCRVI